jgi:hypothetical protein
MYTERTYVRRVLLLAKLAQWLNERARLLFSDKHRSENSNPLKCACQCVILSCARLEKRLTPSD